MFLRLAGKRVENATDDFYVDDMFESRAYLHTAEAETARLQSLISTKHGKKCLRIQTK
jgi:hypothetical protein